MGIGDSIGKAAENAMEDLAGTSRPTGDAHVPEPGKSDDDIQVHSSLSEGSNAMENSAEEAGGRSQRHQSTASSAASNAGDTGRSNDSSGAAEPGEDAGDVPRDVPGAAGLPSSDPDKLRADPSEGDEDPSTNLGRG
ncbi:MAG TPA: hypothetical protein VFE00_14240 [Arthrobacter sp.]|nr:hypothetical protein [Arthrobacter sp.]